MSPRGFWLKPKTDKPSAAARVQNSTGRKLWENFMVVIKLFGGLSMAWSVLGRVKLRYSRALVQKWRGEN